MEKPGDYGHGGGFLLLLLLLLIFLIWNILAGSVRLPASEIWTILQGGESSRSAGSCCRSACRGCWRR